MTREEMKSRLRARGNFRPEHNLSLDSGIDDTIQIVWDFFDWSWKLGNGNFTSTGTATHELNSNVDSILELTYGDNNRIVEAIPSNRLTELYNNIPRTGETVYHYRLSSTTPEQLTLEMVPTPSSGDIFKYRFRKKLSTGNLGAIPSKLHPTVLIGTGVFLATGDPFSSPAFMGMLSQARDRDKPIVTRRWNMGLDSLIETRVNRRNSMMSGGMAQNTLRPTD